MRTTRVKRAKRWASGTTGHEFPQAIERTIPPSTRKAPPVVADAGALHTEAIIAATPAVVAKRCRTEEGRALWKNRMGSPAGGGSSSNYAAGDRPEFVAGIVLQAIEERQAQYFANDRLRKMAGVTDLGSAH